MDDLTKYWPSALGVVVVIIAFFVLKPDGPSPITNRGITGQVRAPEGELSDGPSDEFDVDERERRSPPAQGMEQMAAPEEGSAEDPKYLMVETVIAVPTEEQQDPVRKFKTDDSEVQNALGQVQVVLWRSATCKHCEAAASFLSHNKVSYQTRDVGDPAWKEKLRRLSGGTSVPVIEVDGAVVRGFSEASLQAALTRAVTARVAAN